MLIPILLWLCLAVISVIALLIFPPGHLIDTADPKALFHILLAVLTFSILTLAGIQALALACQEKLLRQKTVPAFFGFFPPLQTMEVFLFRTIAIGFVLLTLLILTSLYSFHDRITVPLLQKIVLAFLAWIIFGGLLLGRFVGGWRGKKAIYGTLIGVLLLLLLYLGSVLLLRISL